MWGRDYSKVAVTTIIAVTQLKSDPVRKDRSARTLDNKATMISCFNLSFRPNAMHRRSTTPGTIYKHIEYDGII
jgi:hypothetical protein